MCSVEYLREFVNERLTAAAEEIFGVFIKTIVEYEEEIDRQRKLLEIVWKPQIKLQRIELPQQHVCEEEEEEEEEVLAEQQLCDQEGNSSVQQEEPEPPRFKEEQEELCSSQEGEQLVLKQETNVFMWTPTYEENGDGEDQTVDLNPDEAVRAAEKDSSVKKPVIRSVVLETDRELQLLSYSCHVAENKDQKGGKTKDSGSARDAEPKQNSQQHSIKSQTNNVKNATMVTAQCNMYADKNPLRCDICEIDLKFKSKFQRHLRIHTGERPYICKTCGKEFSQNHVLKIHMRIHTGEKPFICKICGRDFRHSDALRVHMRIHTGEKPFICKICGSAFRHSGNLTNHLRHHIDERPYL